MEQNEMEEICSRHIQHENCSRTTVTSAFAHFNTADENTWSLLRATTRVGPGLVWPPFYLYFQMARRAICIGEKARIRSATIWHSIQFSRSHWQRCIFAEWCVWQRGQGGIEARLAGRRRWWGWLNFWTKKHVWKCSGGTRGMCAWCKRYMEHIVPSPPAHT